MIRERTNPLRRASGVLQTGILVLSCGAVFFVPARAQSRFHDAPASADALKNPYAGQADAVAAGGELYAQKCVSCHGPKGERSGNIPPLSTGDTVTAKDGQIFWFITQGNVNNGMPSWAGLPKEQRWRLVTFLKSGQLKTGVTAAAKSASATPGTSPSAPAPPPPFTDYRYEKPGVVHHITPNDLPAPFATESTRNTPQLVPRQEGDWPKVPAGFKVDLYATGLVNPRNIRRAPNGDYFVAESEPGDIKVFRGITADSKPEKVAVFASNIALAYGIAFYPPGPDPEWVYIGAPDQLIRFPYKNGDMKASGPAEKIANLPGKAHHWTRGLEFSDDGKTLFVGVGSGSNIDDPDTHPAERNRADILTMNPDGSNVQVYASGIRNPGAGIAMDRKNGELWASVNERDALGDNLVPDYITHIQAGGFYGWPWYYIGSNPDPRLEGKHPELREQVIVPDVLLQPHVASLQLVFYDGNQFPATYQGDIFASEHGSWNRATRVGYEVIRIPRHQTKRASGEYQDFVTGFVRDDGQVWGRPVGVAVATDGSLLVSDDGSNSIWRVSYTGK
ncbi:MAG: PQQ-dependent sugar dehydrogenase [Candidatus Acidiferrales bacterium]